MSAELTKPDSYAPRSMRALIRLIAAISLIGNSAFGLSSIQATESTPRETTNDPDVSFSLDIQPILTAKGCNQGACHGKQRGQNGFQLSLLGFDNDFDHAALTREGRGRRIFPASPERSLLVQKATGELPHGGGRRLEVGDDDYQTLLRWIRQGAPRSIENEPTILNVELSQSTVVLEPKATARLSVTAVYSDGSRRDVTAQTSFQSNAAPVAKVNSEGVIEAGDLPGETAVMARYLQNIAVCNVLIPLPGEVDAAVYQTLPRHNFIDEHVFAKLLELGVVPSEPAADSKFLRRVYLDIIGRLPTAEEARSFLEDPSAAKREALVDALLQSPEYADHWSNLWADLLRPNPYRVGIKAVLNYDNWIRQSFRRNVPYDEFVTELVTATGSTWTEGNVTLFRDRRSPDEIATLVSQLFLGIRLECAKCHHHPFEKWGQDDFYGFAAYFARVGRKGTGLSPPISGGEEMVVTSGRGEVRHPLTNEVVAPKTLFGESPDVSEAKDPRRDLAQWMTSEENEYFARVQVNRIWQHMMGRGIVEPVDDMRSTNPPVNEALLAALGEHFQDSGFDNKEVIRTIANSYVYSLSSLPNDRNIGDLRNYSRNYRRVIRAEALLDSIVRITGVNDRYSALPPDSDSREIWTHRVGSTFLDTFGRPNPNQDPPCERFPESTMTQTLHLMNSPELHGKLVAENGHCAELAASERTEEDIIQEVYLSIYSRFPTEEEVAVVSPVFKEEGVTRLQATQDLMWALLNSPEFSYRD